MTTPYDAAQLGAEAPAWDPGCRESEPPDSPSSHVISGGLQRGAEPAASVLGPQWLLGCCLRNAGTPRPAPRKWPAALSRMGGRVSDPEGVSAHGAPGACPIPSSFLYTKGPLRARQDRLPAPPSV